MRLRVSRHLRKSILLVAAVAVVVPVTAAHGTTEHSPSVHHEREPADSAGRNDTPALAERLEGIGTGRRERSNGRIKGTLSTSATDVDFYAVRLDAGDVIGARVRGSVLRLSLHGPAGQEVLGSRGNVSYLYPAASPLPRGERGTGEPVLHHIAPRSGRYTLSVASGTGPYEVTVSVLRPGPERAPRGTVQTLYLDFDGATVDTTNFAQFFAVPGIRQLSPLASFLPGWGLSPADEPEVIQVIMKTVRDILGEVVADGPNPHAAVRVVSSTEAPDPYGAPNVTRVVVGGSIEEAVFTTPTVGVAESIDPGNFAREETALVLLDLLSGPSEDPTAPGGGAVSLNRYMTEASDRIAFVGHVLGHTAAHEAGHLYGNFHTNGANDVATLMDGSGSPLPVVFGAGSDSIGGTADDVLFTHGRDLFDPNEAFIGDEDTLDVTAFALSRGRGRR